MDHVPGVEVLDGGALADLQLVVEAPHLGELVVHPFIKADAVVVAALDHKRARGDQRGHFGVVEGAAHVPLPDLILVGVNVVHRHVGAHALAHPFIEVAAADAQAVVREHGRCAHR